MYVKIVYKDSIQMTIIYCKYIKEWQHMRSDGQN